MWSTLPVRLKCRDFISSDIMTEVCPPTTTYSTYNVINAPKELFVAETTAHYAYAEQWSAAWNWVMNFLKNKSK